MANSSDPTNILVFGATGLIGQYIIQEIYNARSSFEKIGIFTSESTAKNKQDEIESWKKKGIEVIVGDVTSEDDVAKAYEGYDTVVSALGRNAILAQVPVVKLAEASSSIKFFYPSEYGTDIEYNSSSATEKPHQLKLQVRKYIREHTQKLKVTYLVTGPYSDLYFGKSPEPCGGSFDVKERKATLLGTGNEKVSFTTEKDVGRLLVAALKTPTSEIERILKVNSFTATPKQVLAEFEKQTGAKWDVSYISLDDLKKAETEAWEKDSWLKTMYTLRRIWTEGGTLYEQSDSGKVGFDSPETIEKQVKKVIAKQS
ncbi:NAD(P)-binding protein [Setomelanomma holmii]|uniref:NAD(P)-binding protein n=1 Tax=Setomelanomma holmii TaxID=210430 RepID=A0A9P4H0I1_9PLEO|nr:NAD(P)-binding protein [Setomelanomma holmii]